MTIRTIMASCGSYLPEKVMTNADLEKIVETSDEWIVQRSGIKERRIAADNQSTADMAVEAAREALENGSYKPEDIDGIIVATSTPDRTFPSVAVRVQAVLEIPVCMAFDVQAVCSGFVYALTVADNFIKTGGAKRILVIGAEKMSAILNWEDRTTCVLFGDGAGAVVVEADESNKKSNESNENGAGRLADRGIHATRLYANGNLEDILYTNGGPSTTGESGHIVMEGKEVFRHATRYMTDIVHEVLEQNNITPADIDWLVPHQANIRIIEATAKKLGLGMDQIVLTVAKHGNTSAASIPLALAEAVREGKIKRGDMLLMEALGAGLTWGAVLVRY